MLVALVRPIAAVGYSVTYVVVFNTASVTTGESPRRTLDDGAWRHDANTFIARWRRTQHLTHVNTFTLYTLRHNCFPDLSDIRTSKLLNISRKSANSTIGCHQTTEWYTRISQTKSTCTVHVLVRTAATDSVPYERSLISARFAPSTRHTVKCLPEAQ